MYKYCVTNGRNINTSDECYTPPAVYDAVLDYAVERYNLQGKHVVRPFIPGGDYQKYVYVKNDVVVDNPPFSMTTEITNWYIDHNIPFFMFINGLYGVSLSRGLHGHDLPGTYCVTLSTREQKIIEQLNKKTGD